LFTSKYSKLAFQPLKPVQPNLKSVQPVSVLFLCHPCSDLSDVRAVRKVVADIFGKPVQPEFFPAQPVLDPVESPAE
jgi:hypothetical protein